MLVVTLSEAEHEALQQLIHQEPLTPEARRAQGLLWLDERESVQAIASQLRVSRQTVYNWVASFFERSTEPDVMARLTDRKRSGRPSKTTHLIRPSLPQTIDPLLADVLGRDPRSLGYRSVMWSPRLLKQYLCEVHQLKVTNLIISEALARLETWWTPHSAPEGEFSPQATAN